MPDPGGGGSIDYSGGGGGGGGGDVNITIITGDAPPESTTVSSALIKEPDINRFVIADHLHNQTALATLSATQGGFVPAEIPFFLIPPIPPVTPAS